MAEVADTFELCLSRRSCLAFGDRALPKNPRRVIGLLRDMTLVAAVEGATEEKEEKDESRRRSGLVDEPSDKSEREDEASVE
jgi:hypothetical protein